MAIWTVPGRTEKNSPSSSGIFWGKGLPGAWNSTHLEEAY